MKGIIGSSAIALALVGGAFVLTQDNSQAENAPTGQNVSMVDGKQIVEITAKGRYQPSKSVAKAGVPTIVRFNTNGTFDCTSAVRIPSMGISKSLPPSGVTDVEIGNPKLGTLEGTCGMGMYPFEIEFQS